MDPDILVHDEDEQGDRVEKMVEELGFLQHVFGHGHFLCLGKNQVP